MSGTVLPFPARPRVGRARINWEAMAATARAETLGALIFALGCEARAAGHAPPEGAARDIAVKAIDAARRAMALRCEAAAFAAANEGDGR